MKKKKDAADKFMKDLADRNNAAAAHWDARLKKSYLGEVDGHVIDIIIWVKIAI
jgi:hypothetical protein